MTDASAARWIQKIDHVAIALPSIASAVPLFRDVLGGQFLSGGDNDETGIRLAHFALGGFKIELLQPIHDDSVLGRHLSRRGEGFHHLTFMVDDVDLVERGLAAHGYSTVGTSATHPRWTETFLPPSATFGALFQFAATTQRWDVPTIDYGIEDVTAGRVVWKDWIACVRDVGGG
jgi:methylmalonyl-CoA epimerase